MKPKKLRRTHEDRLYDAVAAYVRRYHGSVTVIGPISIERVFRLQIPHLRGLRRPEAGLQPGAEAMSTSEALASIGIINTHDLLRRFGAVRKTDVAVAFHGRGAGRSFRSPGTTVFSPSHKTDPEAHWMDYGCKNFIGRRAESLPKAKQWASEQYGIDIHDWVPCPTGTGSGTYISRYLRKAALDALKDPKR